MCGFQVDLSRRTALCTASWRKVQFPQKSNTTDIIAIVLSGSGDCATCGDIESAHLPPTWALMSETRDEHMAPDTRKRRRAHDNTFLGDIEAPRKQAGTFGTSLVQCRDIEFGAGSGLFFDALTHRWASMHRQLPNRP